jgi:hypothetical protein
MTSRLFIYVLALCCAGSSLAAAGAQTPAGKSSSGVKESLPAKAPATRDDADPLAEARRAAAMALVTSLADEARGYRDDTLRVRVQARAADALWGSDRDGALALFQRAWEAAEAVDKAGEKRAAEERRNFLSGRSGLGFIPPVPNLRIEVLRYAARRDRELGEKFLARIEEDKKSEASDAARDANLSSHWDPTEPPTALTKRLELAALLLEGGDVERSLLIAEPALGRVTKPGIIFLYKLRQKNAAAADQRFAALLTRTAVDPSADANSVSLLSSYAFTPLIFATVTRNGRAYGGEPAPAPDLSAPLRAAFFRTAAQVLLRPAAPPGQDHTSAGPAGTYLTIARLLPLFEQHAPERVTELRAYLASLTPDAPESVRSDYAMLTAGFTPDAPAAGDVQAVLDQLRLASGSAERDRIYVSALRGITKTDAPRAREIADKIEDPDLRRRARAFVDFAGVRAALEGNNAEEALRVARAGNLPPVQRVWVYTEVARLLRKADPPRVLQLLNEALTEARRVERNSPESARALTAVATHFFDVDRPRAWEVMAEVVKASGSAADFAGEGGKVTAHLQTGRMVATFDFAAPSFDLNGIFGSLAQDDMQRAIELARGFPGEDPRATAVLAIARSVLEKKPERAGP